MTIKKFLIIYHPQKVDDTPFLINDLFNVAIWDCMVFHFTKPPWNIYKEWFL